MKECRRCKATKPASEFRADPRYRDGLASWCAPCFRENNRLWTAANPARQAARAQRWTQANPDVARETNVRFKRNHSTKMKTEYADWAKSNRGKRNASSARHKAAKLKATPPWADQQAIKAIYNEAARIQRETGVRMHVDHIHPLQHPLICGLHCETNLQILPGAINEAKRNRWSPEDAQRQGDMFLNAVA